MALKYFFEFKDVKNILHRVEISNVDFVEDSTEVKGSCTLTYSETDDTLSSFRGSGLTIDLEANDALNFDDLYSEDERTFSVTYVRDSTTLFNGWLSPEGLYQSFTQDSWIISLDCTDGLGFLSNLSYVEDATGLIFTGKQSGIEIISNCLKRTEILQNINVSIRIVYTGLLSHYNMLSDIYFNANRFIKDDGITIMNCEEVIKSILEPFGACITSLNGAWYIYKPNDLFNEPYVKFRVYDSDGVILPGQRLLVDFTTILGSQINGRYPHHVNTNQQISTRSSIGAFRINYKYGLVNSFIPNNFLVSTSDTEIEDFTIIDDTYLSFPPDRQGIYVDAIVSILDVLELTDTITLTEGSRINFFTNVVAVGADENFARFEVKLVGLVDTYYLKPVGGATGAGTQDIIFNGEWTTTQTYIVFASYISPSGDVLERRLTIASEDMPESGDVELKILTSGRSEFTPTGSMFIKEVNITPNNADANLQGENHTFQRTDRPSSKIKDVKTVFNGDNPSDIYEGTIYKSDEDTPTSTWNRVGVLEEKPILQIMGEERMRMYASPLKVFDGDVFGYLSYLSVLSIDAVSGKFMPIKYSYDALNNITTLTSLEILNTELEDLSYEVSAEYGNVVEPTIKG